MFGALWDYLVREVNPRLGELARASELWVAVIVGASIGLLAPQRPTTTGLGEVLTILLAYAAIAFGFSIAGLTVALTLPDAAFVHKLATLVPKNEKLQRLKRKPNAYSDLLFVYSWTAVWHWIVLVLGFVELAVYGAGRRVAGPGIDATTRTIDGLLAFVAAYAALQFLVTLITLSQVGNRYIEQIKERAPPIASCRSSDTAPP